MKDRPGPHDELPDDTRRRLQKRAILLAATEGPTRSRPLELSEQGDIYLHVRIFDESYALPLETVGEVVAIGEIVHLPQAPEHMIGLTRLRGRTVPLVDLRRFWHGSVLGHADSDMAVIVEKDEIDFGIICTELRGLFAITTQEIKPAPPHLIDQLASSLRGLTAQGVMLIDLARLFEQRGFLVGGRSE